MLTSHKIALCIVLVEDFRDLRKFEDSFSEELAPSSIVHLSRPVVSSTGLERVDLMMDINPS